MGCYYAARTKSFLGCSYAVRTLHKSFGCYYAVRTHGCCYAAKNPQDSVIPCAQAGPACTPTPNVGGDSCVGGLSSYARIYSWRVLVETSNLLRSTNRADIIVYFAPAKVNPWLYRSSRLVLDYSLISHPPLSFYSAYCLLCSVCLLRTCQIIMQARRYI